MLIYEPSGRAREYSPLALNHYKGCTHNCTYCYVPRILGRFRDYNHSEVTQKDILRELEKELSKRNIKKQVLLSFTTDAYNGLEPEIGSTRKVLELFVRYGVPTAILTKGGKRLLRDIDLFKKLNCKVGQTVITNRQSDVDKIELGASSYQERIDTFKALHENGIKTFISIEPMFDTSILKGLIEDTLEYVDQYLIGLLSGNTLKTRILPEEINLALNILRKEGKEIYLKHSLRELPEVNYIKGIEDDFSRLELYNEDGGVEQRPLLNII